MKIGAQLYTVREFTQTKADFRRTMKIISDIGYEYVQLSAIGGEITPADVVDACQSYHLQAVITHSDVNRILNDTDRLIEEHKQMGCKYIGLGMMPAKYRGAEWISYFVEDFKKPAKKMKEAGMLFMYHNHDFEFEKVNNKRRMDYLLEGFTPDEMGFILDTYWLQVAGTDVCQWIEKCKDRIPCVHLKDRGVVRGEGVMTPVGEGNMNFRSILQTLSQCGCEYALVEQDICQESPFQCLEKSYHNLKCMGY